MKQTKPKAWALTLLLCGAILWPVRENWRPSPRDDFPFSYYPMFSYQRNETYRCTYLVGYDSDSVRHLIPYRYAGSGGFNQVRRQINADRREGRGARLLARVAETWQTRKQAGDPQLVRIDLVQGRYHIDRFFLENDRQPIEEDIIHTLQLIPDAHP
ncbi:MAG: hypothetical protein OHK0039_03310 [Bacteroidia bacterium]